MFVLELTAEEKHCKGFVKSESIILMYRFFIKKSKVFLSRLFSG